MACTRILGIDGTYSVEEPPSAPRNTAGAVGAQAGGAANTSFESSGGAGGSGGTIGSAGGTGPAAGGTAAAPDASPTCANCAPQEHTACTAGKYQGPIRGTQSAVALVGLTVTGTVTFTVSPSDAAATARATGTIDGRLDGVAPFSGALSGSVDCGTGTLTGTLSGDFSPIPGAAPLTFEGKHTGSFAKEAFSGDWDDHDPATTPSAYSGSGTWSAAYVGP